MEKSFVAKASVDIIAPVARVWRALVTPEQIKRYFFGTTVVTDWKVGSPILWKGEWKGKPYEDKGEVVAFVPDQLLKYTHFSPLAGKPDAPENYQLVTIELHEHSATTHVALYQDNNPTEEARQHSEETWRTMLTALKDFVEKQ